MNDLVQRLSAGRHPVEISLRPTRSVQAFKECLDRDYVHVKFTQTRGGTELGVPVDRQLSDFSEADFEHESGRLKVAGELTLDYARVRCIAEITLPSLNGEGWLEPVDQQVVEKAS
jgi:hypothetical protein